MLRHLAIAAALSALLSACGSPADAPTQAAAEPAKPDVALYALDCGRILVSDADAFADDGSFKGVTREFVDPCYLIRHPSGDLLWDAGIPDALAAQPDGLKTDVYTITVPTTLQAQLQTLGLGFADIEYFSISHSHFDHLGNANALAATATFLVDKEERDHMFRAEARADAQSFSLYNQLETAKTTLIEGDADYDVFGDGSVKLIAAQGHTPGHRVLLADLPESGPVLLTGDLFHLAESRERRTVPSFNTSREETLAAIDKVEALAAATGARVIRQHVPEDFAALPRAPEALR